MEIRIEGLDEAIRDLKRLPGEIERELNREFGSAHGGAGSTWHATSACSEHEVERRASRAIDKALRRLGFGSR